MKQKVNFEIELKKNPYKGTYIAIEGIDGCGKTTQAKILANYFKQKEKKVILTREPRKKGLIGDLVHKVLLGETDMHPKAFQYLFTADRVMHYEDVIIPALKEGKIVISDRCFWSAIVYGILDRVGKNYNLKEADQILIAQSILSMYHQFIIPDYSFYLKISFDTSLDRIKEKHKKDKKEIYEDKEKLEQVIKGYNWLSKRFKDEIITVNGEKSVNKVTEELLKKINIK
jgi:dTMP kinase